MVNQETKLAAGWMKEESAAVIVTDSSPVTFDVIIIDTAPLHEKPSFLLGLEQDILDSLSLTVWRYAFGTTMHFTEEANWMLGRWIIKVRIIFFYLIAPNQTKIKNSWKWKIVF